MKKLFQRLVIKWNSFSKKRRFFISSIFVIFVAIIISPLFAGADALTTGIFTILIWVCKGILWFLNFIISQEMTILMAVLQWQHFSRGIPAVDAGWIIARDFCNMLFILVLLVIAFSTILNYEAYSYKRWLGKLVIAAVLINFSKTITGLMIDFSQVIMITFVNAFRDVGTGNLIKGLHLDKLYSLPTDEQSIASGFAGREGEFAVFATVILAIVLLVVVASVVLVIISLVIGRMVTLWILVILSPIAYFLQGTPFGKSYASRWWSELGKNLTAGPVLAFFLYLAFYTIQMSVGNRIATSGGPEITSTIFSGMLSSMASASNLLDFIIVIGLLMMALKFTQDSGAVGAKMAGTMSQNMSKWGKGTARKLTGYGAIADRVNAYKKIRTEEKNKRVNRDAMRFGAGVAWLEGKARALPSDAVNKLKMSGEREATLSPESRKAKLKIGVANALNGEYLRNPLRRVFQKKSEEKAEEANVLEDYKNNGQNYKDYIKSKDSEIKKDEIKEFESSDKLKQLRRDLDDAKSKGKSKEEISVIENKILAENQNLKDIQSGLNTKRSRYATAERLYNRGNGLIRDDDFGNLQSVTQIPNVEDKMRQRNLMRRFRDSDKVDLGTFYADEKTRLNDIISNRNNQHTQSEITSAQDELNQLQKDARAIGWSQSLKRDQVDQELDKDSDMQAIEQYEQKIKDNKNRLDISINNARDTQKKQDTYAYLSGMAIDPVLSFLARLLPGFIPILSPYLLTATFGQKLLRDQGPKGEEIITSAHSATHNQILEAKKMFDAMSMTEIKAAIRDRTDLSDTAKAAARLALMEKGGVKAGDLDRTRSELQTFGADRYTMKDFEKMVFDKFPTRGIYKDSTGRVITDGERDDAIKNSMSWFGAREILNNASPSGIDESLIKTVCELSKGTRDLTNAFSGLREMQRKTANESAGNALSEKLKKLDDIMKLDTKAKEKELKYMQQLLQIYSQTSRDGVDSVGVTKHLMEDSGGETKLEKILGKEKIGGSYIFNFADLNKENAKKLLKTLSDQDLFDGMEQMIANNNETQMKIWNQFLFDNEEELSESFMKRCQKMSGNLNSLMARKYSFIASLNKSNANFSNDNDSQDDDLQNV